MAKPKVRREGVIITKFPPPVPHDLDSQLSWAVAKSLGKAGGCTAAADPDGDGWAMDVRVAKPEATADWAQRLITLLRKRKVARQSTMELSVRTGPIEASVYSAGDDAGWSSLLPAESESAWADVFIKIPGRVTDYDTLVAELRDAIKGTGEVDWSLNARTYISVILRVQDARNLATCVRNVCNLLTRRKVSRRSTITACAQTMPQVVPVYEEQARTRRGT